MSIEVQERSVYANVYSDTVTLGASLCRKKAQVVKKQYRNRQKGAEIGRNRAIYPDLDGEAFVSRRI